MQTVVSGPHSEQSEMQKSNLMYPSHASHAHMYNGSGSAIPKIPSHMAHSRTPSTGSNISIEPYFMNYHTHSRSASGNFNYGQTTTQAPGHNRSASGGGGSSFSIDLSLHGLPGAGKPSWSHSRTPSNCSNISFISRLSEPISGGFLFYGRFLNFVALKNKKY